MGIMWVGVQLVLYSVDFLGVRAPLKAFFDSKKGLTEYKPN
jgi:hypothetical protein